MLIVIEGIDGSGKSTLAKKLANALELENKKVLLTREPGGSQLGKSLRKILQTQPIPICPVSEFLLFAADRAQHFNDVVMPALAQNNTVISDRMGDSSLVYQGFARGIDKEKIKMVNEWAMQKIQPMLTIYLKISREQAARRLQDRTQLTAFEKEKETFVDKLIHGFDTLYHNRTDVLILDATQSPETIAHNALKAIHEWKPKSAKTANQINC